MSSTSYTSWESEYNHRGTFNIILTCLSTLTFCVWSAVHLSIPRIRPSKIRRTFTQLFWVIIGLLLPELLILAALGQLLAAKKLKNSANLSFGIAPSTRESWYSFSSTVIEEDDATILAKESDRPTRKHPWTLVHGFYAKMGGFAFDHIVDGKKKRVVLSAKNVIHLLESKPDLIPDLSEEAISDRSKADGLAKILLFMQVTWFCVNSFSRLQQDLPLTLLEVSTLAHAFCSLTAYALWWYKPLNILEPTIIHPDSDTVSNIGRGRAEGIWSIELSHVRDDVGYKVTLIVAIVVSIIYGVPHIWAWNADFPTTPEQTVWRLASITVFITGSVSVATGLLLVWVDDHVFPVPAPVLALLTIMVCLAYFLSSLYLVVESFRQLSHLPLGAFQTPHWSNYVPHVG